MKRGDPARARVNSTPKDQHKRAHFPRRRRRAPTLMLSRAESHSDGRSAPRPLPPPAAAASPPREAGRPLCTRLLPSRHGRSSTTSPGTAPFRRPPSAHGASSLAPPPLREQRREAAAAAPPAPRPPSPRSRQPLGATGIDFSDTHRGVSGPRREQVGGERWAGLVSPGPSRQRGMTGPPRGRPCRLPPFPAASCHPALSTEGGRGPGRCGAAPAAT